MNLLEYNRTAWNHEVERGNRWTVPASPEEVSEARRGRAKLYLTPSKPTPADWLGELSGLRVLCLASGGGQQGPLLAAMGAVVTVLDNADRQLAQDRLVAEREGLSLRLEQGDMRDLSRFADESFDLIFHPVSNCFVDDVRPVWRECYRVLGRGGSLLSGFCNPVLYLVDYHRWEAQGELAVRYTIPYSDLEQMPRERLEQIMKEGEPLEFGHSLESQIGGQLQCGFSILGFYEDANMGDALDPYIPTFIATRAVKR